MQRYPGNAVLWEAIAMPLVVGACLLVPSRHLVLRIASLSAPSSGRPPFRVETLTLLPLDLECTRSLNSTGLIDKTGRIFCLSSPVLLFHETRQAVLLNLHIDPSYARMPFSASRAALQPAP